MLMISPVCDIGRLVWFDEGDSDEVLLVVVVSSHLAGGLGGHLGHAPIALIGDFGNRFILKKKNSVFQ